MPGYRVKLLTERGQSAAIISFERESTHEALLHALALRSILRAWGLELWEGPQLVFRQKGSWTGAVSLGERLLEFEETRH